MELGELRGMQVFLRGVNECDVALILEWENTPEFWDVSGTTQPYTENDIIAFAQNPPLLEVDLQERFMICLVDDERPIGALDLFEYDPKNARVGVGVLIADAKDRRNGYALEALRLIIDHTFGVLEMHTLFCNILPDNEASLKLFEKAGFHKVGLKKSWTKTSKGWSDELLLQITNA